MRVRRSSSRAAPEGGPRFSRKDSRMKKFLVLYKAPASSFEQMKNATPEQQKAGMDAWMSWGKNSASSIVDMGGPLGKSLRVTKGGSGPVANDLGGYSVLQAESKEALAESLKGHPHFLTPEGTIEIVEVMAIPGM
jgi:hypothetical protein